MALSPPTAPTAPDLNSPSTYNARVLAGFTYCFTTLPDWIAGLDASDWFSVQSSATDTTYGKVQLVGYDADFADLTVAKMTVAGVTAYAYLDDTDGVLGGAMSSALRLQANGTEHGVFGFVGTGSGIMNIKNTNGDIYFDADINDAKASTIIRFSVDNTEAMRIDSNGNVVIGGTTGSGARIYQRTDDVSQEITRSYAASTSYAGIVHQTTVKRAGNSAFTLAQWSSGDGTDIEAKISGDGNMTVDGAATGGGADRAECIERHPDWFVEVGGADMRGVTVVLDGGYIRPTLESETPIGVISDTYDSLGNAAPLKWEGKYLKDDLGSYILEEYEVVEWAETVTETTTETVQATEEITRARDVIEVENGVAVKRTITEAVQVPVFDEFPMQDEAGSDLGTHRAPRMIEVEKVTEKEVAHSYAADAVPEGVTVPTDATRTTQQRKVLNPAYDPNIPYTPRLERPEWDAVGVLGICRVLAGQPVAPTWIKMRDVSGEVEEWLVR